MTFFDQEFHLLDPKFLPYFLPKELKKGSVFSLRTLSFNNKNLEFEVIGLNIVNLQRSIAFLKTFENRFYLYKDKPFFPNQEFSLSFKSLDFSTRTFIFSNGIKSSFTNVGLLPSFIEKDNFLRNSHRDFFVKSRIFALSKGGFISCCFNNPAFIVKSSFFYKFYKYKSYRGWFSLNLRYYGFISYFRLINFRRANNSYLKRYKKRSFLKRFQFYGFKNETLRYVFLLGRPKSF